MKLLTMKKVSSVFFVLALLLTASFTLTSCGGDDNDSGSKEYTMDQYETGILGQWKCESESKGNYESILGKVSYYDSYTKINISFNGSTGSCSKYEKETYTGGVKKGQEDIYDNACEFSYKWETETGHWGEVYKIMTVTVTKVTKGDFYKVGEEIILTVNTMTSNKLQFDSNKLVETYALSR